MPEPILEIGEKLLIALGTIIGAVALFWSRFAGLFPARRNDVAEMKKSVDRLHTRLDDVQAELKTVRGELRAVEQAQAEQAGFCRGVQDRRFDRPAE